MDAQYGLGLKYYYGEGVEENDESALHWFKKSADQGHEYGSYYLARCYFRGEGTTQDYELALPLLLQAELNGIDEAAFLLFSYYIDADEDSKVLEYMEKSMDAGNLSAKLIWALHLERGQLAEQNYEEAASRYEEVLNSDGTQFVKGVAAHRLALLYLYGHGVEMSEVTAYHLLHKAIENGYSGNKLGYDPHYDLGYYCYYLGKGTVIDYGEAIKYLTISHENGNVIATSLIGTVHYNLNDHDQSFKWYALAADAGEANAQYMLGLHYERGYGSAQDLQQAQMWYRRAADNNHPDAQERLQVLMGTADWEAE